MLIKTIHFKSISNLKLEVWLFIHIKYVLVVYVAACRAKIYSSAEVPTSGQSYEHGTSKNV